MTGAEHYREAERLVEEANHVGHEDPVRSAGMIAAAQVHATLAQVAATADYRFTSTDGGRADTYVGTDDSWARAIG